MARTSQRPIKPRPSRRKVEFTRFRLAHEIRYIQRRAAARDGRVVAIGQRILFSTGTVDAWVLDPADHFAAPVARDGEPRSIGFLETSEKFVISWPGDYRIDGPAFIYIDRRTGRVSTILGYPTQLLEPHQAGT
jgi:hypothetical protein